MIKITSFVYKKVVNFTLPLKNDVWVTRVLQTLISIITLLKNPIWPKIGPQVDQDSRGSPHLSTFEDLAFCGRKKSLTTRKPRNSYSTQKYGSNGV